MSQQVTTVNMTLVEQIETRYPGLLVTVRINVTCQVLGDEEVLVISAETDQCYFESEGPLKIENDSINTEHQRFLGICREKAREVLYKQQQKQQ